MPRSRNFINVIQMSHVSLINDWKKKKKQKKKTWLKSWSVPSEKERLEPVDWHLHSQSPTSQACRVSWPPQYPRMETCRKQQTTIPLQVIPRMLIQKTTFTTCNCKKWKRTCIIFVIITELLVVVWSLYIVFVQAWLKFNHTTLHTFCCSHCGKISV